MTTNLTRKQIEAEARAKLPGFRRLANKVNGCTAYRIDGTPAVQLLTDIAARLGYAL